MAEAGLLTPLAAHTIDIQFLFPGWHGGILGVQGASQSTGLSARTVVLVGERAGSPDLHLVEFRRSP
jgi:hypothetical protein